MSHYITAHATIEFKDKEDFEKGLKQLMEDEWIIKTDNGEYAFTDESGEIIDNGEKIVVEEEFLIRISQMVIRNGWSIINQFLPISSINGRVYSTDGTIEFHEINNSVVTILDDEEIVEGFGLEEVKYSVDMTHENTDIDAAYDEYREDLDYALMVWVSD